ncbi:MAG: YcxB family protein [Opitutaceae bacterium]|jgi:hypothetical protein
MQFTITLIPLDYVNARRLALRPRTSIRIALYVLLTLLAAALAGEVWTFLLSGQSPPGMVLLILAPVYFALFYFVFIPFGSRRIFRQQKNLQDPATFAFTDQGMRVDSVRGHMELPWSDFHKWKANDKVLLLYHSSAIFNMIPRRAFATAADFAAFRELVERHLGKQKA